MRMPNYASDLHDFVTKTTEQCVQYWHIYKERFNLPFTADYDNVNIFVNEAGASRADHSHSRQCVWFQWAVRGHVQL